MLFDFFFPRKRKREDEAALAANQSDTREAFPGLPKLLVITESSNLRQIQ
tara:strand:- start:965 stop:1114 length:150 start_codon:yes stop_codon:yes gene_type:complete